MIRRIGRLVGGRAGARYPSPFKRYSTARSAKLRKHPAPPRRSDLTLPCGAPRSAAAQTLQRPSARAGMTSHHACDMHRMVQKPRRHQNFVPRDMTRPAYKSMSGWVNLGALYGNVSIISFVARTVLRRYGPYRYHHAYAQKPRLCLSRSDPQYPVRPRKRHAKTSAFRRRHLILHRARPC